MKADRLLLGLVGLAVVALAWRGSAEFSAWLAFDIAERQPLGSVLGRQYLAAPVHALSFRPGSVLLLKILAALGTPLDGWLQALSALVVLPFLWVGRQWGMQRLGLSAVGASCAAALALLTPAGLFNAWHLGELDLLGAALLLGGDLLLKRGHRGAVVAFAAAILLKDSVAVLSLVCVGMHAWEARRREGTWDTAPTRLLVGLTAALAVLFLRRPEWGRLIGGPGPKASLVPAAHAGAGAKVFSPAIVALAQLVALVGPVSVGAWWARRAPGRWAVVVAIVAVFAPEPARFHVYLSYVYGSVAWVLVFGVLALAGLAAQRERDIGGLVLAGVAAFVILPVVLRMRGDLSARVFLPLAVPLFGFAVAAVVELRSKAKVAAWVLALGLAWQGIGGAWDFGARFLSLERVELGAKGSLVEELKGPTWLFAVHRAWLVSPNELAGLGAEDGQLLRRPVVPFAVERPDGLFPGAPMRRVLELGLPELAAGGERALLYEVGLRSRNGDGLRGTFLSGPSSPWPFPPHSFEDDHYRVTGPRSAADGLLAGEGSAELVADWSMPVWAPPPRAARLTEALLFGAPLLERLDAIGRVSRLEP